MSRPGAPTGRPLRVLVVEDPEDDAALLVPEGMERVLREADGRGEPFEVVISEDYMPRFRASDALALLRGLGHDVPFIVVSGKIGEDAAVGGTLKAGADDYLSKENLSRLCPAIECELGEAEVRRERARAKEALARSEARFRRLVEHVGRHSMQQRALELGGELEIESESGEGTRVRFRVPITRLVQG